MASKQREAQAAGGQMRRVEAARGVSRVPAW
jgi:hypothetical protein